MTSTDIKLWCSTIDFFLRQLSHLPGTWWADQLHLFMQVHKLGKALVWLWRRYNDKGAYDGNWISLIDEIWQVCISDGKFPLKKGYCYWEIRSLLKRKILIAFCGNLCHICIQAVCRKYDFSGDTGRPIRKPCIGSLTVFWIFMNIIECILW